jgi:phosphoserine aminotransferase
VRVFNFAAGPAALPQEVLEQAREELLDWQGSGSSVMEISHRSKAFLALAREAESDLRALLAVPDSYRVLFMQGGATAQFAAIPMNLAGPESVADYVDTGHWSRKAIAEARRFCRVQVVADASACADAGVPPQSQWRLSPGAAYLHYTPNETIGGVEFPFVPHSEAPLVADMSSTLLSRPLEVGRFGLIYAGAQKNIGPAGLCLLIVRQELIGRARAGTPAVWDFGTVANEGSMLNTPPTFAWYFAGLVFKWLRRQGGLEEVGRRNRAKAELLYRTIDESPFYRCPVEPSCRSWMNVVFRLAEPALEPAFLTASRAAGLANLAGHRATGGMRASLYNAVTLEAVTALCGFMRDFARRHG